MQHCLFFNILEWIFQFIAVMLLKCSINLNLNVTLFILELSVETKKTHCCFRGGILVAGIVLSLYGLSWTEYTRHWGAWLVVCFFIALGQYNVIDNIFWMLYLMVMSWRFMIASSTSSMVSWSVKELGFNSLEISFEKVVSQSSLSSWRMHNLNTTLFTLLTLCRHWWEVVQTLFTHLTGRKYCQLVYKFEVWNSCFFFRTIKHLWSTQCS